MNDAYLEMLRRQYNAAIANGLVIKARMIERLMKSAEARDGVS